MRAHGWYVNRVLLALADDGPDYTGGQTASQISEKTGFALVTVYSILRDLERAGQARSYWPPDDYGRRFRPYFWFRV